MAGVCRCLSPGLICCCLARNAAYLVAGEVGLRLRPSTGTVGEGGGGVIGDVRGRGGPGGVDSREALVMIGSSQ